MVVSAELLVARGNPTVLLDSIDESLHAIALSIDLLVEGTSSSLIGLAWNGHRDAVTPKIPPHRPAAIAFVSAQSSRPLFGAPRTGLSDLSLLHQRHEGALLVALSGGQHDGHGQPFFLGAQMRFGRKASSTAAQRLSFKDPSPERPPRVDAPG